MKKNQKEISIKSLIKNFSIETTPNVYTKYGNFSEFLNHKNSVYVTYLPDEKSERVIDTSKKLNEHKSLKCDNRIYLWNLINLDNFLLKNNL